jgi:hypothetical protein
MKKPASSLRANGDNVMTAPSTEDFQRNNNDFLQRENKQPRAMQRASSHMETPLMSHNNQNTMAAKRHFDHVNVD